MQQSSLINQRLASLFLVGLLVLFSPLLGLFEGAQTWRGIPLLYLYLFGVWALLIAASAWIVRGRRS